ncbi:nitroreductase family protein [Candidatus Nanohalobium constans]|uniref:Nitroreductase n=1 Tax=Candidatus Nanohalobium constans TaxID=2565781 RepID=A0A5Q0UH48_9ARCH|nr:nitroreductase family protein [Candidatus Nanohalobium constans]QGA80540.1 nitroreductase [Candidatus Nanohalobium constans]
MKELREDVEGKRNAEYEISPLFLNRYSPRALERDMNQEDLMALFEAARWAPSSYNNQSWRFMYATYEDQEWEDFCSLMNDFNRDWAEKGYALVVVASKTTFDHNGEESITHSFDTGAAWENLALEAARRDLVAHGMQGFDYKKAKEVLDIPEGFEVEAMVAIGSKGDESELPEDMRVEPNGRKDMDEIVAQGSFDF